MPGDIIICPNCKQEIELSEAMRHTLRKEIENELKGDFEIEKKALIEKTSTKLKKSLEKEIKERIADEMKQTIADLEHKVVIKSKALEEAEEQETKLRQEKNELKERERKLNIEIERRLEEETQKLSEKIRKESSEEHNQEIRAKDKKIRDMNQIIEELKIKSSVTPSQLVGEIGELVLEEMLEKNFPDDEIIPIPVGKRGADIQQRVFSRGGIFVGSIVWEVKRTKKWQEKWISKLKDDQRKLKAEFSILVTKAMPADIQNFGMKEDVLVIEYNQSLIYPLLMMMRNQLYSIDRTKRQNIAKDEKLEFLHRYLSSPEFIHKFQSISEAYKAMKDDLEKERRALIKQWEKRNILLDKMLFGIGGLYGDVQGILGATLPEIETFNVLLLEDGKK